MKPNRMPPHLPPDLDRLGDQLAAATRRAAAARRRRVAAAGRLATTAAAAALAFAVLGPGVLSKGDGIGPLQLASSTAWAPVACDQPRGATFRAARPCGSPGATDASPVLFRRYAER
jgi:hypothetical protein